MPAPLWGWFAVALALLGAIEWEERSMGYLRRGLYEHVLFWLTPVVYVAAAFWLFVGSPLTYAQQIRAFGADACESHHGFDGSSVVVVYQGHYRRNGRLYGGTGPPNDEITVTCNDRSAVLGSYVDRRIVYGEQPAP